jgi:hypothetical protein
MSIRHRLAKLEKATFRRIASDAKSGCDLFEEMRQMRAYAEGKGPRPKGPPCPPWINPNVWASRVREGEYIATGKPPAGLTAAESYGDEIREMFRKLALEKMRAQAEAATSSSRDRAVASGAPASSLAVSAQ